MADEQSTVTASDEAATTGHLGPAIDTFFPREACDALARLESYNKHLYRPNTYLHKWWARRSGVTFRHILKQLAVDPQKREYYSAGGLDGQVILDPMMGGATILHEAIRMGASVAGIDIDPIPIVQAKASLSLADPVHQRRVFDRFLRHLRDELRPYYATHCPKCGEESEAQFYLHGLRKSCNCGESLVVDSFTIRHEDGDNITICPSCRKVSRASDNTCSWSWARPLIEKGTSECSDCGRTYSELRETPFSQRYVPLVTVGCCPVHGQFFKSADGYDMEVHAQAEEAAEELSFGPPDHFMVPQGPKSQDLLAHGVTSFLDLFSPRQLIYLHRSGEFVREASEQDKRWLALLLSTSLEFNCLLCGYKGGHRRRPGAIRHVFSHHAYSFPYTALENNPAFPQPASGTLARLFRDRIARAAKWARNPVERVLTDEGTDKLTIADEVDGGEAVSDWHELERKPRRFLVLQSDAGSVAVPQGLADHIVTDPPYYDSVQYSDLSAFFRVWLRWILPEAAEWDYDVSQSAVSEGNTSPDRTYRESLTRIWRACASALKGPDSRLIFTFHHWKAQAWADLTVSLRRAGFRLVNSYVVSSENPTSVHIRDLKAIKHDSILVLAPGSEGLATSRGAEPMTVAADDSFGFCRGCARALGWLLDSDMSDGGITDAWHRLLA